jgi:hypothetical protein
MRLFTRHINILASSFAVLFFLSSAGFTTILHYCCHDESDDEPAHEVEATVDEHSHSHEGGGTVPLNGQSLSGPGNGCHRQVVAGGLDDILALVEKPSPAGTAKPNSAHSSVSAVVISTSAARHAHFSFLFQKRVFPPPVEKYVLNETFLI